MTSNRRVFLKQLGLSATGLSFLTLLPGCRTVTGLRLGSGIPRSTPEVQGVSSAGIQAFIEAVGQSKHEFHSFMLLRHRHVIAETWWSPYAPELNHTMYSMSKSFASTAIGFAVAEGRLRVNDRVTSFFPEDLPAQVSDNLAALTVKDCLTMSTGHGKEPTSDMVKEENWVKVFLGSPITNRPGTTFMYNSGATYMLSAIVQKVTGQKLLDYLTPRLLEPLGIQGASWESCPRGTHIGGWGLSVRTEGLAKFGQIYLQGGQWNGRQILPATWVKEATSFKIQQPLPSKPSRPNEKNDWLQGYCYQFWRSQHHAYRGDGAFGQYTIILPEQDAVIAITSETNNMQGQLDLIWEHLLPAMKPAPLPVDRKSQDSLQGLLSSQALAPLQGQGNSPVVSRISGKTFEIQSNELGFESASFSFRANSCLMTLRDKKNAYPIICGSGKWVRGETALPGTPPRLVSGGAPKPGTKHKVAGSGTWTDGNTYECMLRYYETPHHDSITCRFDGSQARIAFMNSMAKMSPTPKDKRPILQGQMLT